ncbi:MAG: dTDP-4-dehydrorhamnose reductase [Patescibacteria group bacterium]
MISDIKILILGAKGMLGHDLMAVFEDHQPTGWDINEIDITNKDDVFKKIGTLNPEIIINAAAYTDVDGAEKNKELAMRVNREAVGYLAEICVQNNIILVHYSTDYVFHGNKKEGYKEEDIPEDPVNFYGQSKLLGEKEIKDCKLKIENFKYYLIRTAWLFGPKSNPHQHKNFVDTILKLAQERKEIKVVDDQFGSPTYTYDLARATKELIEKNYPSGIYHLTNSGMTNWYQFAKKIVKLSGLKTKILPCSSKEFLRPAKRPKYSFLVNTKFPKMRFWQEALSDYLNL